MNFWKMKIVMYAPRKANMRKKIEALSWMKDSLYVVVVDVDNNRLRACTYCGVELLDTVEPPLVSDIDWRELRNCVISGLPPAGWKSNI
jgi:hypothetical protein